MLYLKWRYVADGDLAAILGSDCHPDEEGIVHLSVPLMSRGAGGVMSFTLKGNC